MLLKAAFAGIMRAMAAYLDKIKVTSNGRISLGGAAMRNLGLQEGDLLEVFFDERDMSLVIKKSLKEPESAKPDINKPVRRRKKDHGAR